jgi:hypothetical protein
MRFKEADGRKVVSADCAESIGRIEAYVIDTGGRSVSAFRLAKAKVSFLSGHSPPDEDRDAELGLRPAAVADMGAQQPKSPTGGVLVSQLRRRVIAQSCRGMTEQSCR